MLKNKYLITVYYQQNYKINNLVYKINQYFCNKIKNKFLNNKINKYF